MLAGQPGVIDVVKLVQKKPLKEWVTVYFDPTKTTSEKVLKHLREKESKEAAWVPPVTEEKAGVRVVVENPVAGPGDLIQVAVRLPDGAKGSVKVNLPPGWSVVTDAVDPVAAASFHIDIQAPKTEKPGRHEGFIVVSHGKEEVRLPVAVDLVPRVEPMGK